jgi:ABC-type nitrate/sulfonate/bicarbonate transport system permease component
MAHLEDVGRRSVGRSPADSPRLLKKASGKLSFDPKSLIAPVVVLVLLVLWQILATSGVITATFFTPPTRIAGAIVRGFSTGEFVMHIGLTLERLLLGVVLGGLPALVLGLIMGWKRSLRRIVDPLIALAYPIPKISLLPLVMVIFGIGETSKIVLIAISAFFPMLISAIASVRQINPIYRDVARNYGANRLQIFTKVIVPGSLPVLVSGIRITINTALLITLAVELISANEGLGSIIWMAWRTLLMENLYAALVVISVLGLMINWLLLLLEKLLLPWHQELS